jgi:hypothetical protein
MFKLEAAPDLFAPFIVHESARYLNYIPMGIGYWLTPDSLVGQQVSLILVLWFKALCVYLFVRRAVPSLGEFAAAFAALLAVLYPGDADFFYFTTTHNHLSVAFVFLSGFLLLAAQDAPRGRLPLGYLISIGVCLTLALSPNEGNHPIISVIPLALLFLKRWEMSRQTILIFAWWYAVQALWVIVYLVHLAFGLTRHRESLATTASDLTFLQGMFEAFLYLLSGAWGALPAIGGNLWLAAGIGTSVTVATLILRLPLQARAESREAAWLFLLGVVVIFLGYLPFSLTPKNFTWKHTLFLATSGAAFIITAAIGYLLARLRLAWPPVFAIGLFLLLKTAVSEHARYVEQVALGARNVETVVRAVPSFKPETQFLFMLDPNIARGNNTWRNVFGQRLWHPSRYRKPLEYAYYRHFTTLDYCVLHVERGPQLGCRHHNGQVVLAPSGEPLAIRRTVAFLISADGVVSFLKELPESSYLPLHAADDYEPGSNIWFCVSTNGRAQALFRLSYPVCTKKDFESASGDDPDLWKYVVNTSFSVSHDKESRI